MALTMLFVAQASSAITTLIGIFALYLVIKSSLGLLEGDFRKTIILSSVFIALTLIGIVAMTLYHFTEGKEIAKTFELIWYIFIFASLLFSILESYKIIQFGKFVGNVSLKIKSRKKRK